MHTQQYLTPKTCAIPHGFFHRSLSLRPPPTFAPSAFSLSLSSRSLSLSPPSLSFFLWLSLSGSSLSLSLTLSLDLHSWADWSRFPALVPFHKSCCESVYVCLWCGLCLCVRISLCVCVCAVRDRDPIMLQRRRSKLPSITPSLTRCRSFSSSCESMSTDSVCVYWMYVCVCVWVRNLEVACWCRD